MKRSFWLAVCILLLSGCSSENKELTRTMELRNRLLAAQQCSFQAEITADYGEELQTFSMDCAVNTQGDLTFQVIKPETIAGIRGTISDDGGTLDFEDTVLCFDLLTDHQLTPVSAPWIFIKSLRGGCITSVCTEEETLRISVDDSYAEGALRLDIWVDSKDAPVHGDILYEGKRILSLNLENYVVL